MTSFSCGSSLRFKYVGAMLCVIFCILLMRLCWVCTCYVAGSEHSEAITIRAPIVDRHGQVLASSVLTFSIYAHPKRVSCKMEAAKSLHAIFPALSVPQFLQMLSCKKSFVWLVRHVTPEKKLAVQALGIEGIDIHKEHKRIYPHGNLFCHAVGILDTDQNGISGLEKSFDKDLRRGVALKTSLDMRLQYIVHEELKNQIEEFQAQEGNALLADMKTGEILAMVSFPDFLPAGHRSEAAFFNRNVSGIYEFGSMMKIHNVALFLESGKGTLQSVFDASHPLCVGRFRITDISAKNRPMTVEESFKYSSNIANAKIALASGGKLQRKFFEKLGFMKAVDIELPEKARSIVPAQWTLPRTITAGYGYGFAITPLHVLQSVKTIVSGFETPLTLKAVSSPLYARRIISKKTSEAIIRLMGDAVLDGQAKKAAALTCEIGAKTGTANLRINGRYCQKENLTSCVSIFPIHCPRYILLVSLHRPKPNKKSCYWATAGWIAAPLVSRLVDKMVPLLGILIPAVPSICDKSSPAFVNRFTPSLSKKN
jgi:cell division protein FtsI (penicillin-binding protein 3)